MSIKSLQLNDVFYTIFTPTALSRKQLANLKRIILISFALVQFAYAQIGGRSTFQFLDMPVSARATAQGGIYNHLYENDAGLARGNPAMLQSGMHKQMSLSYFCDCLLLS